MLMQKKNFLRTGFIVLSLPFLLAFLVLIFVRLAIHNPELVEKYYSSGIYPVIADVVSGFSGRVFFSLWDVLWISAIVLVIAGLVLVVLRFIKLKWYLLRVIQALLLFYSFFYILWGFNYFRPAIDKRLGWRTEKPNEAAFRRVLDTLIVHANSGRINISASDYPGVENSVEDSYRKNGYLLGIDYHNSIMKKPKKMILSSYFVRSGISGYFGPFFNEVNINYYQLPVEYPFILAHEKAHQFGIANEAEASFAGFIICACSPDRRVQYSGYMYLLLYFLKEAKTLPDYHAYLKKIDKAVMDDILLREEYYDKLTNKKLEKFQNAANNAYLKSNHIHKGIKNYDQVTGLMISWYRQNNLAKSL